MKRASAAEMADRKSAIYDIVAADQPMTVRQVFYRMVSAKAGGIGKDDEGYKAVDRALVDMREDGTIPFEWIADNGRRIHRPVTFESPAEAIRWAAHWYRRSLWDEHDELIIVAVEKDALAGVLESVTDPYAVPLIVVRGFSSITYMHDVAQLIMATNKPTHVYYFGDHDPSGLKVRDDVENKLDAYTGGADITFHHEALTPAQITSMGLPTRPTKYGGSHAATWTGGDSVDLDAIPPADLRAMVEAVINRHVSAADLAALEGGQEREDKDALNTLADAWEKETE